MLAAIDCEQNARTELHANRQGHGHWHWHWHWHWHAMMITLFHDKTHAHLTNRPNMIMS
ncbi:MAG: hypothetical protein GX049_04285 [Alcaligenaceae bacterium]|nr:hypothetical protein [Alcaligenaceae bacterium]